MSEPGHVTPARNIELAPPHVGGRYAPIPLTGPGTLALEEDALVVTASRVSNTWVSHVILASVLFFGVGGPIVFDVVGLGSAIGKTVGVALVGGLIAWAVKKGHSARGEPMTLRVPRANVRKVERDPHTGCLVVVVAGTSPAGGIFMNTSPDSPLEEELGRWLR